MENNLQTQTAQLPDSIEDLAKFALIGREKLTAVRAEIRAIEKVGLAKEVHEQKLKEAQEIAEAVLDAEVKLGELTAAMPKATPNNNPFHQIDSGVDLVKPKSEALKEAGIPQHTAERFERMARHPEAVEAAKEEARRFGEVVTRSDVMDRIRKTDKKPEDLARERVEAREAEIESRAVVDFQTLKEQRQDKEFLQNSEDYDTWQELRRLCRELEKLSKRKNLISALRMAGMWGLREPNSWQEESLRYWFDRLTDTTNAIKAAMMEVLADE